MNRTTAALSRSVSALSDFFLPRYCLVCSAPTIQGRAPLCTHCQAALEATRIPDDSLHRLRSVLSIQEGVYNVFGLYAYREEEVISTLIYAMKYRGRQSLCVRIGEEIGNTVRHAGSYAHVDFLLPIPIHHARLRERRYNQSERIAEGISRAAGIPLKLGTMRRIRKTSPQTFLGSHERAENIRDAFALRRELKPGCRIGLVDDVVTTGATVSECSRLLLAAGAARVTVFCVAVAQTETLLPRSDTRP